MPALRIELASLRRMSREGEYGGMLRNRCVCVLIILGRCGCGFYFSYLVREMRGG